MGQVQDKIALVTGGASGIGEACVQTLAREGAKVVISDIDDHRGNTLAETINASGQEAIYLPHERVADRPAQRSSDTRMCSLNGGRRWR